MNFNRTPIIISSLGALLVILVQHYLRPMHTPFRVLCFILDSAPNFIIGFWFPFSILLRPKAFTKVIANKLFLAWCFATLLILIVFEILRPFKRARTFDYLDILASVLGVCAALLLYHLWLKGRLFFG